MNLDRIIELIAEQIAREVVERSSEGDPDHREDPAVLVWVWKLLRHFNLHGNTCLTVC